MRTVDLAELEPRSAPAAQGSVGGVQPTLGAARPWPATIARPGPLAQIASYFFFAGERWLLRNEIPVRIAFCCTAAAVRPKAFAACAAVPLLASFFSVLSSLALQEAPSLEGRFAIIISKQNIDNPRIIHVGDE